ncbi:MAG: hypothetical protein ABI446_08440 [Gemmatimonadaceae bacterium]
MTPSTGERITVIAIGLGDGNRRRLVIDLRARLYEPGPRRVRGCRGGLVVDRREAELRARRSTRLRELRHAIKMIGRLLR